MRVRLAVAVAAVLLLVGGTAAYGAWSRTTTLATSGTVRAGTMGLTATWVSAPNLSGLYPGQARSGIVKLTHSGNGRWQYLLPSATGLESLVGYTVTYTGTTGSPGLCGTSTIPADTWSATLNAGTTTYACVTVSLASSTTTVQTAGTPLALTVQARNQPTN